MLIRPVHEGMRRELPPRRFQSGAAGAASFQAARADQSLDPRGLFVLSTKREAAAGDADPTGCMNWAVTWEASRSRAASPGRCWLFSKATSGMTLGVASRGPRDLGHTVNRQTPVQDQGR